MGLVAIMSSSFENAFNNVSKKQFIIQSNVFFRDLKGILKNNVSDINSSEELEFLVNYPIQIDNEDNDISISITFSSDSSKVNINQILDANQTIKQHYVESLDFALASFNVIDRAFFTALILDTIDTDEEERIFGSEIVLQEQFFKNGKIENFDHFDQIVNYYKQTREDAQIDKVPWTQIIAFNGNKIDFNHISQDALWFILKRYDREFLKEVTVDRLDIYSSFDELFFNEEDKKNLQDFKVDFFSPKVVCKALVRQANQSGELLFSYNLNTKEVSNIEFSY